MSNLSSLLPPGSPTILVSLLVFVAGVLYITLDTVRIIVTSRGRKLLAGLLGFVEVLVFLFAIGQVLSDPGSIWSTLAYALGFAVGNYVGVLVEERLALGMLSVQIITQRDASQLTEALQQAQFGLTSVAARGVSGKVRLIHSVIKRRELQRLLALVRQHNPNAFVAVEDVRAISEGYFPLPDVRKASLFHIGRRPAG